MISGAFFVYAAKWCGQMAGMNFQTRSKQPVYSECYYRREDYGSLSKNN
ncbi:DUF6783 domain-containing protein [uncultured Robinsoniella sp.]